MKDVQYFAPTEIDEAVKLLAEHGDKATVLAGGTDLVPRINYYELKPDVLLYIGGLSLDYIKEEEGKLVIGAATPTAKLASDALVAKKASALAEGARLSGSVATRNAATIGGNLANASPAADLAPPLLVLDAEVKLQSKSGTRTVPLAEFFLGPRQTVRTPAELLSEIRYPVPAANTATTFLKLGQRWEDAISVVSVAAGLERDGDVCQTVRVAFGSVAPTPIRIKTVEKFLRGKKVNEALIKDAGDMVSEEIKPITDIRSTAEYRKDVSKVIFRDVFFKAWNRAGGFQRAIWHF